MLLILCGAGATTNLYDYATTPGSITAYHGGHINLPLPVNPNEWCQGGDFAGAGDEDAIYFVEVPERSYVPFDGDDYTAISANDGSRTSTSGYCGDGQVNIEDYFFSISQSGITAIDILWDGYTSMPVALYVYNPNTLGWDVKDSAENCGVVLAEGVGAEDVAYFGSPPETDCRLTASVDSTYLSGGELRFAVVETNNLSPETIHTDYVSVTVTSSAPPQDEGGATPTCAQYGGDICGENEVCRGTFIRASDTSKCCNNYCEAINRPLGESCNSDSQCASGKCVQGTTCGDCYRNSECTADQACSNGICTGVSCDCGEIVDHKCEKYECCKDSQCKGVCDVPAHECVDCLKDDDCEAEEYCSDKTCLKVPCECGEIKNHKCLPFQCCADTDCAGILVCEYKAHKCVECNKALQCPDDKTCSKDNTCVDIPCECGEVTGHECKKFECCSDGQCPNGEICDITKNVCAADTPPGGLFVGAGNWVYNFLEWLFGSLGML